MLGKLLKYELKACGRTFIPLYIAILGMSILNGLFVNTELFQIQGVGTLVLVGLFIALGILTVVVIIQRFKRNLLGDEGYLMLTLPVRTKSIILSKYIAFIIYAILSCLVAIASFQIIMTILALSTGSINEFLYEYKMMIASLFGNDFWKVLLFIFDIILILILFIGVSYILDKKLNIE